MSTKLAHRVHAIIRITCAIITSEVYLFYPFAQTAVTEAQAVIPARTSYFYLGQTILKIPIIVIILLANSCKSDAEVY